MKHLKKVLACILSMALIMTSFTALTFADEATTHPGPHFSYAVSETEIEVGDTVVLTASSTAMQVGTITGGFYFDPELLELDTETMPGSAVLTVSGSTDTISLAIEKNENGNGMGFYYAGSTEEGILYDANPSLFQVSFTAVKSGTAVFTYYEDVDGLDEFWTESGEDLTGPSVTITDTDPAEEGYITYNGEKLYDSVIASCLDDAGDAPLADVLTAAGIEATGDCCYVFTSADGYTATLRADELSNMVLFDNDGDLTNDSYSWRNSLKDASAYTGGWYKVTGLATIETQDHVFDDTEHICKNQISVSRGTYEDCGEEAPEEEILNGWIKTDDGIWHYYVDGAMTTGWQKVNEKWYYMDADGNMLTGWQKVNGTWYYLKASGAMATGWQKIDGTWYYLKSSGAMVKGWQKINNKWYFFKSSGAMAANEWCEGYWLNKDGSWTYQPKGSWKKDSKGWWFGDTSGWYAKNTTVKIDNKNYTFNASGYWVK